MTELKPCPFCGNKNIEVGTIAETTYNDDPDEWDKTHYVVCCDANNGGCGASTGYQYSTKSDVIEAWNKRHEN